MKDWKKYTLGELIELINGFAFKSKDFVASGIPVIKIKNVKPNRILLNDLSYVSTETAQNVKCTKIQPSDILITMTGNRKDGGIDSWVGKVALFNHEGQYLLNQRVSAIRIKSPSIVDYRYLAYFLSSFESQLYFINHSNSSGGQANISPDVVNSYTVNLPSLQEQKNISKLLKSLDDKIELNRRINDNLEQQAQALFKACFVDFKPFKDGKFVDSELGRIPEGWEILCADEIYNINIGKTPPRKESIWFSKTENANTKWISISDLANCGTFVGNSSEYLTPQAINKFNIIIVPSDTVLLSFKLTIGRVAIAKCSLTTNEAIARFYLPDPTYREFTYLALKNYDYSKLGSTSSIAIAVNSKIIKNMKMLFPNAKDIEKFHNAVKPIFDTIKSKSDEMERLCKLRDALLPRLMSGELKFNDLNR